MLLIFVLPLPLISLGWFVVSSEDLRLGWRALLVPLVLALLLWRASRWLGRAAWRQK
ncbi:hypothetical protein [Deinococcus geothermalis]|uniref:hypothetical protein n=1 Tax=Deinococcus geothermalis TaxID=68909 RepID=UPI0002E4130D|nr:hypothetical protein [Deinococcus geothermalis]